MLTVWQRLARITGAYMHGFIVVAVAVTPFDPEFQKNLIIAGWGGSVSCLAQVYEMCKEYGRERKTK